MSVRLDWLSEEMEKRYQPEDDKPKPLPCPAALMYDDDQMATKDSSDNQKRLRPNTDNDDSRSTQEQEEDGERVTLQVNQSPTPPRRPAWVLSGLRVAMWQRRARGTSSESTKPGFSSALSTAVSNTALNIITTVIKASWELRELLITLLILIESLDYPKMK
ncbi:hypothetical protein BY996DRAFT_6512939 [Phakopsora pachyrhizi]|nr:hypothetical protein BY996DRAFT_6512939 [Phakopsora pachyrhizi]